MQKKTWGLAVLILLAGAAAAQASDAVTLHRYVVDYPHQVPGDYVYRTPRVFAPERGGVDFSWNWLSGDKKDVMPAETGTQLKLRVGELASQLLAGSKEPIPGEMRLAVASFVSLDQVYETSALGRYLAEQMLHELQRLRVDVIDVRMMPSMQISKGYGEYVLSRDMAQLNYAHHADAVVAGTYSVADGQIFVNVRLLENNSGLVLTGASMVFEADALTAAMLKHAGQPYQAPMHEVMVERGPARRAGER